jgi:hypothetical protein
MILIIVIAVLAAVVLLIVVPCFIVSGHCSRQEEAQQAQPIVDKPNPSHDPEIPPVVVVTPDTEPTIGARLAKNNSAYANAVNVAVDLLAGKDRAALAAMYGYASVGSMRKALNRYGYSITGQPLPRQEPMPK